MTWHEKCETIETQKQMALWITIWFIKNKYDRPKPMITTELQAHKECGGVQHFFLDFGNKQFHTSLSGPHFTLIFEQYTITWPSFLTIPLW